MFVVNVVTFRLSRSPIHIRDESVLCVDDNLLFVIGKYLLFHQLICVVSRVTTTDDSDDTFAVST